MKKIEYTDLLLEIKFGMCNIVSQTHVKTMNGA